MPEKDWNLEANIEAGLQKTSLIAQFESQYGSEENWSDDIKEEFEIRLNNIQR